MKPIEIVSDVVLYGTVTVCWTFVAMYWILSRGRWRNLQLGRHLMILAGVDGAIFTILVVGHLWPWLYRHPWFQWLYVSLVGGIMLVTAWRIWILWRTYQDDLGD